MFILVQCNTSLSKNYFAYWISVVCEIGWIWEKKQVRLCSLDVCAHEISRRRSFHEFTFDNKSLKTFVKFRIWWKNIRSSNTVKFEFEVHHISSVLKALLQYLQQQLTSCNILVAEHDYYYSFFLIIIAFTSPHIKVRSLHYHQQNVECHCRRPSPNTVNEHNSMMWFIVSTEWQHIMWLWQVTKYSKLCWHGLG